MPAVEGPFIPSLRIVKGKKLGKPVVRHIHAVKHAGLGKRKYFAAVALHHFHMRIRNAQHDLISHKGRIILRKNFTHLPFIIQQIHPVRSLADTVNLFHGGIGFPALPDVVYQIFHRDGCGLLRNLPDGENRLRYLLHLQPGPANLGRRVVYRYPAERSIIGVAFRLQILAKLARPSVTEGCRIKIPHKFQLFLHAVAVRLNNPHIITDAPAILQIHEKGQPIFRFFLNEILQDDIRRQRIPQRPVIGDFRIFHQTAAVHAAHLKGEGFHGLPVLFYAEGQPSVRLNGHNAFLHILFIHGV